MRQWELIGITDHRPAMPVPRPSAPPEPVRLVEPGPGAPVFFWSTDGALRLIGISDVAADVIGRPAAWCRGRDLLEIFGLEGPNAAILDAHVSALGGEPATFSLRGDRASVRCRVQPVVDSAEKAWGTYCVATLIASVDVREEPDRTAVA